MQIKDHVFYVTGGASGLGAATVRLLHSRGALVAIWDLNDSAAESLAAELNKGGSNNVIAAHVDVCSEEEVIAALEAADKAWPRVKIGGVINCGGVGMAGKTVNQDGEPFDLSTFQTVVDINLVGTFNVSRLVAARIVRDLPKPVPKPTADTPDAGVIINTASAAGLEGQTGQAAYGSSKAGVIGLSLPMARDLAHFGIRVMALAPALFSTPMMEQLPERAKQQILRSAEFPVRFGHPDEFAHAVVAIIENSILNGSHIRLDGATRLGKL